MPPSASRPRLPLALAALAALAAACSDSTGPTPGVTKYVSTTPISGNTARAFYGDTLLDWEHGVFYWADRVDWASHDASVRAQVAAAKTHGQLWDAADASIDPWLRDAPPDGPDYHSLYFPPSDSPGITDASPDPRNLASGVTLAAAGQPALAYLWLPGFAGKSINGRVDSIQTVIRTLDQSSPCGWVLDLRRNLGGYTDAMIAGINPIFGNAPASRTLPGYGGDVDRENGRVLWFVNNGTAGVYDPDADRTYPFAKASNPYTLKRPGSPVAVLTGPTTASASEAITIGFRGNTAVPSRTFGEPTYGVTTGPFGIYLLPDSGYLNITATIMFDRTGHLYGGKIQPDELVTGGPQYETLTPTPSASDPVIAAASAWLRQQPACTGASTAAARLNPSREPASAPATAVALPGVVRPLRPERFRPQVHAVPRQLVEHQRVEHPRAERRLAGR